MRYYQLCNYVLCILIPCVDILGRKGMFFINESKNESKHQYRDYHNFYI